MRLRNSMVSTCTLIVLACASVTSANAAPAQSGWTLLWSNKLGAAEQQFKKDVVANPKDAAGWRGLGWSNYYKDDTTAALRCWSRAVELAPTDWSTAGLWPSMCSSAELMRRFDDLDAAAKVLASTPGVDLCVKQSARLVLAHRVDRLTSVSAGDEARKSLGLVTKWSVIGPFDNVSRSGLDRVFEPEKGVDLAAKYQGIDDIQLQWRTCPLVSRDGEYYLSSFVGNLQPNVYYASTAVNAPADMSGVILFNAAGASKLYLNGRLILTDPVYRVSAPDAPTGFAIPVKLRQGWNSLLLKSADDENIGSQFSLSIVDSAGQAAHLLEVQPSKASGSTIDAGQTAPAILSDVDTAVKDHLSSPEGILLQAMHQRMTGNYDAAEDGLRAALRSMPDCAALHWELCQVLQLDSQADDARAECSAAHARSTGIAQAELQNLDNDKTTTNAGDRLKLMKALHNRFPASYDISMRLVASLNASSQKAAAYALAMQAYKTNGGAQSLQQFDDYFDLGDKRKQIEQLVKSQVLADPMDLALAESYAGTLSSKEDTAGAMAIFNRLIRLQPDQPALLTRVANLERESGKLKVALALSEQAAERQPQSSECQTSLAELYQDLGRKSDALAAYRRAIDLAPNDVDLRDKLQLLTGQRPVLELAPPLPTPKLTKKPAAAAGGPSVTYLVDEQREVVYPDYATRSEYHEILRINDDAAAQTYQTFPLHRDSYASTVNVEKAQLIKADGKVEDHSEDDGDSDSGSSASISFPSLATGDVIDVSYQVDDRATGALAHQFWADWYFGDADKQYLQSRFVLITPADMNYKYVLHGGAPEPTDRVQGSWRIRTWNTAEAPIYKDEYGSVPRRDWAPWVDVSTVASWHDIVAWYEDLSSPRCIADSEIRAKAVELTKDATTDDEKLRLLIQYVSHDIQYQSTPFRLSAYVPTEGKQVIRERYGDCKDKAALLTAMLSAVGVKSHMVLLSPRNYGTTPYLPSPRFAHAIAVVDTAKGRSWIDGTADGMPYGDVPWPDQGVPALIVDPSTTDLETSPVLPIGTDDMNFNYTGVVSADGSVTASVKVDLNGNYAWAVREIARSISADKQDQFLRSFASEVGSFDYDHGSILGTDDANGPMTLNVSGHSKRFATNAGNFLIFPLPWGSQNGSDSDLDSLTAPDRRTDCEISEHGTMSMHVELTLPNGYSPQDMPSTVNTDSEWGKSNFTYSFQDHVLKADWIEQVPYARIPRSKIAAYVAARRAENDESSRKLVFKKD